MKYIKGNVNLDRVALPEIPEFLNDVSVLSGNFIVSNNRLTSLKNSPKTVDMIYNCSYNPRIKSLTGCSIKVGGLNAIGCGLSSFDGFPKIETFYSSVSNMKIVNLSNNQFTSLSGLPSIPSVRSLILSGNPLTDLTGCPSIINGDLNLAYTPLRSMINGPKEVRGNLDLNSSRIDTLEGFPTAIHGNLYLGQTPLGEKIFNSDVKKRKELEKQILDVCNITGGIYEDEDEYEEEHGERWIGDNPRYAEPDYDY